MKLIVGNSVYEMKTKQLKAVLHVASKQVPFGIYAVKKDGICELRKDKFDTKFKLQKAVKEYAENGFKVYYNAKTGKGN
nr:MAG TPA: hypothetical protein [Caudoviricetes sp.]